MMKSLIKLTAPLSIFLAFVAQAQPGGGMGGGGFGQNMSAGANKAMMKLFGKNDAFKAKVDMKMLQGKREVVGLLTDMLFLSGKMRMEMDMTQARNIQLPPQAIAQMKQMGMDKTITISRSDLDKSYMIYPGMKSYLETAMLQDKEAKVETTQQGKETIEDHPCVKNKVTITESGGKKHDILVWNATDLKDFPVQWEMEESGNTVVMLYKDIQFSKPDAKQFEIPAEYEKYTSQQEMMRKVMEKMMGGRRQP